MTPATLKVLTKAYDHYLDSHDRCFSYIFKNADDFYRSLNGIYQLAEDGYIDNVSDNAYASQISLIPLDPVTFGLTDKGIDYMRSHRKL